MIRTSGLNRHEEIRYVEEGRVFYVQWEEVRLTWKIIRW
jgi:hypothetical protein